MAGTQKQIGVCMSQAHTFLKTDFLADLHDEGYRVSGIDNLNGSCETRVESGCVTAGLLAVEQLLLGMGIPASLSPEATSISAGRAQTSLSPKPGVCCVLPIRNRTTTKQSSGILKRNGHTGRTEMRKVISACGFCSDAEPHRDRRRIK